MPCVLRQDGSSKGRMDDSFCLSSYGLKAMEASVGVEMTHASKMGFLRVIPTPLDSEWAMIVKAGKWVPLLDKGKVVVSPGTDGCVVGVMERSNSFDDGFSPSLEMECSWG
jgi:carbamate kinase